MAMGLSDLRALRPLLAAMLFVVLAMRVIVPTGFMPVVSGQGVVVTLCTGQGAMNVVVDRDGTLPGKPSQPKPAAGEPCPFAGGASGVALPALLSVLPSAPWFGAQAVIAFAVKTGWIARLAAPPPPAMGPPSAF